MKPPYLTDHFINEFLQSALREDLGDGDHSTLACIPPDAEGKAVLKVKTEGILAGIQWVEMLISHFDPQLNLEIQIGDGKFVQPGDQAFILSGPARSILTIERIALNCMQRMSGIATKTHHFAHLIAHTKAKLIDTRKTTPGFRFLEKWGVLIGGGQNHRLGLYDMIMLKDNHIDMCGGIERAILRTKDYLRSTQKHLKIEIETRSIKEVEEVLRIGGVDRIMLDNMKVEEMRQSVSLIAGTIQTEASGNISENNILEVALTGVDFISVGALTHSYKCIDLSLKIVNTLEIK